VWWLIIGQVLGSAYLLGATAEQLQALYDTETGKLDPWENSPMEISSHDWRDYLGEKSYCFSLPSTSATSADVIDINVHTSISSKTSWSRWGTNGGTLWPNICSVGRNPSFTEQLVDVSDMRSSCPWETFLTRCSWSPTGTFGSE
jgi:hypothetical protein